MELINNLLTGFGSLVGVAPILAITAGVIFGIWVGAMPGLSPSMGVALMLPFTFRMPSNIALIMLIIGALGSQLWIKVTRIPQQLLIPLIISIAVVGSFAVKNSMFDVFACIGFGVLGWILKRHEYPMAPIVLGMVLGKLAEANFRRAVIMGGYSIFFTRPASVVLLVLSILSMALPLIQTYRDKKKQLERRKAQAAKRTPAGVEQRAF